jgi:RNA polymerase I specific initiation factor
MASVFALPVHPSRPSASVSRASVKKRKRDSRDGQILQLEGDVSDKAALSEEYTAVVTPDERSQRRLAGYSLGQDLLRPPFPHKSPPAKVKGNHRLSNPVSNAHEDPNSLRLQHISAISALLHKSLLKKDYTRARRALGLILRTDVNGRPIDIRTAGNWAVAAELLLHQFEGRATETRPAENYHAHFNRGFVQAKALYEMLIVQYPYYKSHPDSINAVNFYFAMFNLWIFVSQAEGRDLQASHQMDDEALDSSNPARRPDVRANELRNANEIAGSMDKCMVAAPYKHDRDLLKLRAMVSEWQADLNDKPR